MGPRPRLRKRGLASTAPAPPTRTVAHIEPSQPDDDGEENVRTFMDAFHQGDDDDGALSDSQPDIGAHNDSSDDEGGVLSEDDDPDGDDDDVRVAARKQKFPNLDSVMDENNFDALPEQEKVT